MKTDIIARKVTVKELSVYLGVSYSTGKRMKKTILDSLIITDRDYLRISDLVAYGLLS